MSEPVQYLCPPLLKLFQAQTPVKVGILGRGTGKSTYIGYEIYDSASQMPRSLGSLYGPTYAQLLTKIFPSAKKTLLRMGLKEDRPGSPGHFTIGKKPPDYFNRPYNEPEKWEYVICIFNGAAIEFISMDRPDSARGGSYDYQIWDEAALVKKEFHDNVAGFTLRGNRQYFGKSPKHGMQVYVSSQAHSAAGYWVEDQKYLRDEQGDIVLGADAEATLDPDVTCVVGSSYENIAILGEKTLKRWKKNSSPMAWKIEVMSERGGRLPNSFYPGFDSKRHTYFGGFEYDYDAKTEFGMYVKRQDTDRNPRLPLEGSCDFNAALNTLLISQEVPGEERFLNEFYENGNAGLDVWLKPFLDYYQHHGEKLLRLWGDPGGNKIALLENKSTFQRMQDYLQRKGWKVEIMVEGRSYPTHRTKHAWLNEVLQEKIAEAPRVRMHYQRCKYLIHSLENTPIKPDFQKDKASERQDIDQRLATHAGDAFDYRMYYRYHTPARATTTHSPLRVGNKNL